MTQAPVAGITFGRRLQHLAEIHPHERALLFAALDGTDREVSWSELEARSNQMARLLADRGAGIGRRVVIARPNSVEHVVASWATWKVGGCVMPMRWDLPEWERDRLLETADPAVVIDADFRLAEAEHFADDPLDDVVAPSYLALASSGSTGRPKLIQIMRAALWLDDIMNAAFGDAPSLSQLQVFPAPLYHNNGFMMINHMLRDQPALLMEKFDAARLIDLVERYQAKCFVGVTTMLQRIVRLPDIDERDLSSLDWIMHGGAPLPRWLGDRLIELVGPERFTITYGSSERFGATFATGLDYQRKPGTVGVPFHDTELRIVGEDGEVCPTGEVGEIYMRIPDGEGYDGPPSIYVGAEPAKVWGEGFRSLGDLGWLDEDGYLFLADRRTDMIITGGVNVFPAEVEACLSEHPDVADVAVVGLPDEEWGRRVHAIVQPTIPSRADDEPSHLPGDLLAHARARLAPYKVPKSVEIVDRLPRTDAGKINRRALADERSNA